MRTALLVLIALVLLPAIAAAPCGVYFYGNTCPHCADLAPHLDAAEANGTIELERHEVYANRSNLLMLQEYFDAYDVSIDERGVPVLFTEGDAYIGGPNVRAGIASATDTCPRVVNGTIASGDEPERISILVLISAALVDAINPCAITVLVILLSTLLLAGDRMRALRAGLAFTASIYIAYTLFGLGLLAVLAPVANATIWFERVVGLLAIVIGLFNLKDYFWYAGGGFVMEIPRAWRPRMKALLKSVTSPLGAFLIGFLITLFELPCTGGPYLFVLGLLADRTTMIGAVPYLLFYNLFFVLPLLLITLLVARGMSAESIMTWKETHTRNLHLVAGIVLTVLGVLMLLGVI